MGFTSAFSHAILLADKRSNDRLLDRSLEIINKIPVSNCNTCSALLSFIQRILNN